MKYCVLGAGPSGLAAVKNLLSHGIDVEGIERQADVGGLWNINDAESAVYESAHLISSKRLTEFVDFRMPREYPHYPSHRQVLDYLRAYADKFGLREHIRFQTEVASLSRQGENWCVRTLDAIGNSQERIYRGVVIANGHHRQPHIPEFPGEFNGRVVHARSYRCPQDYAGQRVLVVGCGNSGCDIAAEVSRFAARTCLSLRRGYHFLPKYLFGAPIDRCGETMHRWHIPRWLFRWISRLCLRVAVGPPEFYGLPAPDHPIFSSHPIVNDQILSAVGHGRVHPRPDIDRWEGPVVRFNDGSTEEIDVVILATGYELAFPFMDKNLLNWKAGAPRLYLNIFHPEQPNLFVCGMIQPNGGIWPLADYQSQLIAAVVNARDSGAATWFQRQVRGEWLSRDPRTFVDSPRHAIEVDYFTYRDQLRYHLRKLSDLGVDTIGKNNLRSTPVSRQSATPQETQGIVP